MAHLGRRTSTTTHSHAQRAGPSAGDGHQIASLLPSLRATGTVAEPGGALHELLAIVRRRAKWQSTTREAVAMTVKQIADTGGDVAGVVLTQVNIGKNAGYRYGDSMLYTKAFSKYYTH